MKAYLVLFFPLLFFASCFEVVEELDLKTNASGTFTYTINMSQSKLELNTALKLDTFMGVNIPTEGDVRMDMERARKVVSSTNGISKATYSVDFENYIFIYKIQFDSLAALNSALENAYDALNKKGNRVLKDRLLMPRNVLTRESNLDSLGLFNKLNSKKKGSLKDATYTCVYRFESAVESVSNKNARTSKNGKAVMLRSSFKSLLNNESTLRNNITLSKQ
jgi:hypothetical protein